MPEGVAVDIVDGVATIEFTDKTLRGRGIAALLAAGGPEQVQTVTLPRKAYVTPEAVARAAGMLDETFPADEPGAPQGYDDGKPDMDWSRKAINDYATKVGVESPDKLSNKKDVLDAIDEKVAAESTPPGDQDVPPAIIGTVEVHDHVAGTPATVTPGDTLQP